MTAAATRAPSLGGGAKIDLPPDYLVLGRAGSENFPVASRLLPGARSDLMALYGWARLVDQLGDDYAGNRLAALNEVERQLRLELSRHGPSADEEIHPLVSAIAETVRRLNLTRALVRPGPGQPPGPDRLPLRDV